MRTPSPARSRIVVFDLDDTLYLERDYARSGLAAVGAWARPIIGTDRLGPAMLGRFEAGARMRIFDDALRDLGIEAAPQLIARMLAVYRQHRPRIALAADAVRFLERRSADTGLAIITDGFLDAQKRKLRALGLHRRGIGMAICTDCWGREAWKPHPRAFEALQRTCGLDPHRFVYVADNPTKDFSAPRRLGWRTVRIARADGLYAHLPCDDREAARAERRIESLDALE